MKKHVLTLLCLPVLLSMPLTASAQNATPVRLVDAARAQIGVTTQYNGRYERIAYPGGDVPLERGVCTDVVIRAYRKVGVDLQELVHKDMKKAWDAYPHLWQLKRPDPNIDHRRVPNLATYFKRHGKAMTPSRDGAAYQAGDIVTWMLPGNLPHIGIVAGQRSGAGVPLVIHNIGNGTQIEDRLFAWPLTGHYRWNPDAKPALSAAR
ncbi:DUF1287 domain-containing protein [Massilia pseudoviolaceinigra]|uniref:DUF1287 domain-containing protein n=1 Tax=Massilia pseudoviolaceinigra TaxID=3057165 RepID=UPI002796BDFC|nr:DUF1287 domain-containing protein [Massilia sp. CCM 9206]MDQ1920424.1 DUF1287 domain-containing protein [Massilia sp. CCM 9206]